MCEFLSISVRKDGAVAHDTGNSHTTGVTNAGWLENTDGRNVYANFEWDGKGGFDLSRICHDGVQPEDLTDAQIASVKRIYGALEKVIAGSITEIMPGGVLNGIEWWDVYIAALDSGNTSGPDKLTIRKELMTATAGDKGTATAGDKGTATAGDKGTATAGDYGTATAGDYGTATAGDYGTATAGHKGTATAGDYGTATAGGGGTATAGGRGTATAGGGGTATAGYKGTATAGYKGTATAGCKGTATAGEWGLVMLEYYDYENDAWRKRIGEVTPGGELKAGVAYKLNYKHEFVEAK